MTLLEIKSRELKKFVSQYDSAMFLGDISSLMNFIKFDKPIKTLQGLSSPQRQLYYLAALNLTSDIRKEPLKPQYSDSEFEHIKKLLNEIEGEYEKLFYPKQESDITEEWLMHRRVAMPSFLSFFNEGRLNYEEQVIERVKEYFTPFNKEIEDFFGLNVSDFIDIYNYLDTLPNQFLADNVNKKEGQQTWKEFAEEMLEKGIMPDEWNTHMPSHFSNFFNFMYDHGQAYRFSQESLAGKFGEAKATAFLSAFTCKRQGADFVFYTEKNILYTKPIFSVGEQLFQAVEMKQIIHSTYNLLADFCINHKALKERFYKVRGDKLESKTQQVFENFLGKGCTTYKGFYTQDKHEQDLMFVADGLALIVEAKASKRHEPKRDPDKAYGTILNNFEEVIQKGYDQCYRIKNKFITRENINIFSDAKLTKNTADIKTKRFYGSFSIIVTLERFGQIQTDLEELLEIYDNDEYPWSICIDDLEIFLLQMSKTGKKKVDLYNFLVMRQQLHGRLIASDELDVCGGFLSGALTPKFIREKRGIKLVLPPNFSEIFDKTYRKTGLGFKDEKNMEIKTSNKYFAIGD